MEHPFFMNGGGGGGGNTARAEALRWLTIAEKLLTNRDLVGSKSFATRARESDPTLYPADQILGIVDTLIAGDKRINNQHLDYYSILQIPSNQTHDSELIANQYRQLALLLNPQKNNFPFADHAFRLVVDAWSVLSNAFRRSVYDKEIGFFLNLNPVPVTSPPHNPIGFTMQQPSTSVMFEQPQSRERLQTVTFLQDLQTQQPVTFTFGTSLGSEREQQQPFTFGTSSTRGQQQQRVAASVEQQGNKQAAAANRNEGILGNNQNHPATTTTSNNNVNSEGFFWNNQNHAASAVNKNVNNEGLFGNNQNPPVSTSNKNVNNVNNEGLFGNNQNRAATAGDRSVNNVNSEGLLGNNQNRAATTGDRNVNSVNNGGLFGNNQNRTATAGDRNVNNVNNEGLLGNNKNRAATTGDRNVNSVNNEGLLGNNQNRAATTGDRNVNSVNNEGLLGNNQNRAASVSNKIVNNVSNEGLFGNNPSHTASTGNKRGNSASGKEGAVERDIPSFWTACPYCLVMYEYALDYLDCTLRCQNCKRAFQAVKIASPPPLIEGKEAYVCCWGYMPLGFSVDTFKKHKGNISSWTPFAPVFNKQGAVRKSSTPRVYIDDLEEDVFLQLSESSEESDEDWGHGSYYMRKKAKSGKKKSRDRRKKAKIQQADKGKKVEGNDGGGNVQVSATQGGVEKMPKVKTESSKRGVASNTRRQSGKVPKNLGKLDLNVELSNDVEDPPAPGLAQGNGAGTGEEGNIEGIEFFEGLDEFLSSLPILNPVGDDKVKAA